MWPWDYRIHSSDSHREIPSRPSFSTGLSAISLPRFRVWHLVLNVKSNHLIVKLGHILLGKLLKSLVIALSKTSPQSRVCNAWLSNCRSSWCSLEWWKINCQFPLPAILKWWRSSFWEAMWKQVRSEWFMGGQLLNRSSDSVQTVILMINIPELLKMAGLL
jgi:hypothetical protein